MPDADLIDESLRAFADLSPRERAAQKLLLFAVLKKLIAEDDAQARKVDGAAFNRAGQAETVELPDGTRLGRVRTDKGTPGGWKVTDAAQLLAWAQEEGNVPIVEKVVRTYEVEPKYLAALLDSCRMDDYYPTAIDPHTGEVIPVPPGLALTPAGPPKLVVTADPKAPAAVRGALGQTLAQLGLEA